MSDDAAVVIAFDRDAGGDTLAVEVQALVPRTFAREAPPAVGRCKHWNDFLQLHEQDFFTSVVGRSG